MSKARELQPDGAYRNRDAESRKLHQVKSNSAANSGLANWMLEVSRKAANAANKLTSKSIHDVRVGLRRCRSMADSFRTIDPDKRWKKMRRQAKNLFDSLGALRDYHVMREWVEKLGQPGDPVTCLLTKHSQGQEAALKRRAQDALQAFNHKQWKQWARSLPQRAARLPVDSEAFQALALEKMICARRSQSWALKTSNVSALHNLRIAVKRFRYVAENFLPRLHEDWGDGLRRAQGLLGEVHDLDVLKETIENICPDAPLSSIDLWKQKLDHERTVRLQQYRESMTGDKSLWLRWRSALPRGKASRHASLKRLQAWTSYLDSDVQHSRRVARFAVDLYDGLARAGILKESRRADRELLRAAATVHEIGRAGGDRNHHKKTRKMIDQLHQLAGWTRRDISAMAQIARFHRGILPRARKLQNIPAAQRSRVNLLAGTLRLANAFDADHSGSIQRLRVVRTNGFVTILAAGLVASSSLAETIAGARHLLEITSGLPILVRPMRKRHTGQRP